MSYSIFRVHGVETTNDLRGIGKHNDERISSTNTDIDKEKSHENIVLVSLDEKSYMQRFSEIVQPFKEEHDERMKTTRADRVKTFEKQINSSNNDVACEFLFASDKEFFKDKSKDEIKQWANASLDFLEKEVGIKKDKMIQAVVHMDEASPHLHVVAVPLVKAYDGRRKKDVWQISRKKFIPTKEDLSKLQDKYNEHINQAGFKLERGEKGSDRKHLDVLQYKEQTLNEKITSLENELNEKQKEKRQVNQSIERIQTHLKDLDSSWNHAQQIENIEYKEKGVFGEKHVTLKHSDFDTLRNLAKTSESVKLENQNLSSKNAELEKKSYNLEKKNYTLQQENQSLQKENQELKLENTFLKRTVEQIKENFKDKIHSLSMQIGHVKAEILDKMGLKLFKKHFNDEQEALGGQKYLQDQHAKKEKEKERPENEMEL